VDAELVLDRGALHLVLCPSEPSAFTRNFGTRNIEMPRTPSARPRRAEHEVDDVLRQIVLAVGNEDFLSRTR